jgi:hypothetical protein
MSWMSVRPDSGVQTSRKPLLLILDPQGHPEHAELGRLSAMFPMYES